MFATTRSSRQKPYHHGDLREALLLAGESALADLPLQDVSLREIARRAGVSHAAPKHHFPTLADMLGEIAARGFQRFVSALAENAALSADQSPEGRLMAMGRAYLRFAAENPAVYGLMFANKAQIAVTPHFAQASFAAWDQLEQAVAKIIGPSRAVNGAMLVWSTVHGLAMLRLEQRIPPQLAPDSALEITLRMMIGGLLADKAN